MGELLAATDLIRRGYYVYRNVSATGPCDIIAFRRGEPPRKIEVKVATIGSGGVLKYPTVHRNHDYDILALITPDGSVVYQPVL